MGYTHYWSMRRFDLQAKQLRVNEATRAMLLILASDHGVPIEVGYSYSDKNGPRLLVEGVGEAGFESLVWPLGEHDVRDDGPHKGHARSLCKTGQKSYDVLVTACLAAAKHILGDALTVTSDGGAADWVKGTELARSVLGPQVQNPLADKV